MMTDPRPPEGPDRDALRQRIYDAVGGVLYGPGQAQSDTDFLDQCADAVLALLPTPPAPGCPSGRCEHRADAHTTHPAGLCLIRGCPCPTPPAPGGTSEPPPDTSWTKTARVRESGIDGPIHRFLTGRHHDKPTPPAPGDQPCAECGVEENRHGTVDGCSGFRPLPAPGDGEGLRAEREHFVRAAAVNVGQDIMAADVRFLFDRLDEARAALAARDTDTADRALAAELAKAHARIASLEWLLRHAGPIPEPHNTAWTPLSPPAPGDGEGLRAEVERLIEKPWALRDQRGQTVMAVPVRDLAMALHRTAALAARDTDQGCTGAHDCPATRHIHGCFAERDTDQGAGTEAVNVAMRPLYAAIDQADAALEAIHSALPVALAALARATPEVK
jgi:hypothetical protein